ncbi:hypothetical protein DFH08DRAFT_811980 [Mycena albidolilacea]|uniref:C2 domain-containing protein n=1 Tax=Mycena albidolilacea TaxID=1033008 RepID=A0AAD6ZWA8_9AGAR|nr:hypothetical protein DFH08DRAFT_811980 [Mycena albidolilacea]
MAQTYELKVKSIKGVDAKYRKAHLCVAIHVDGKWVHNTHPKEASVVMWNDTTTLDSARWADSSLSSIGLRVYDRHNWWHYVPLANEKCLAEAEIGIHVDIPLKYVKSKAMPGPTLVLRVSTIGNIQVGELEIANAKADVPPLESGVAGFATLEVVGVVQRSDLMPVLGTLLESILKLGDDLQRLLGLHCMQFTRYLMAVQNQRETDGKIVQLVQKMAEVYTFAKDADSLSAAKKHLKDTVTTIVQQTAKCVIFVREYTGHGFLGRLGTNLIFDHAKTIQDFAATFVELQQSLDRGLQKYTAFAATHIQSITMRTQSMTREIQKMVQDSAQSAKLQTRGPRDGWVPPVPSITAILTGAGGLFVQIKYRQVPAMPSTSHPGACGGQKLIFQQRSFHVWGNPSNPLNGRERVPRQRVNPSRTRPVLALARGPRRAGKDPPVPSVDPSKTATG